LWRRAPVQGTVAVASHGTQRSHRSGRPNR
jgi:hypothetical protein